MIDIKGCLRNKRAQISEIVWIEFVVYGTALAPIDLLGYFKSGLDFNPRFFLRSPQCCDASYSRSSGDERTRLRNSLERRNQSHY